MTDNIKDKKARLNTSVSPKSLTQLQIKCQCTVMKQNIQINQNKKSKFSIIILNAKERLFKILPYSRVVNRTQGTNESQKERKQQENQQPKLQFPIRKIKMIHKKYIQQGKITIEFSQYYQHKIHRGLDITASEHKQEVISTILISNASKQNLELMIQKIVQINRQIKQETEQQKVLKQKNGQFAKKKITHQSKIDNRQNARKSRPEITQQQRQKIPIKMTRKQMIQLATCPQKMKAKKKADVLINQKKTSTINFLDLPNSILKSIFQYIEVQLEMRLVSRKFEQFVVKNIKNLKFKDEVDQETFNKLAKYAVNVECRMKNVRSLRLLDQFERPFLEKNFAKTLLFGSWKQVSSKNIQQIQRLRIYLLQLPYSIKFDFTFLFGLRIVHLRLKGRHITQRNLLVRDQDIQKFIKINKSLQKLQVAYASQKILIGLSSQQKQRITELTIGTLNIISGEMSWTNFEQFKNLKAFSIQKVLKQGVDCNIDLNIRMPEGLTHCEIGEYLSLQAFTNLPKSVTHLTIRGRKFTSQDLNNLPLSNIKYLDISQCSSVGSDGLSNLQNARVLTCWDKNTIKMCQARFKGIIIETTR